MFDWVLSTSCIMLGNFFTKPLLLRSGGDGQKYEWTLVWDRGRGGMVAPEYDLLENYSAVSTQSR